MHYGPSTGLITGPTDNYDQITETPHYKSNIAFLICNDALQQPILGITKRIRFAAFFAEPSIYPVATNRLVMLASEVVLQNRFCSSRA
jgi:hypothetical protein